MSCIYLSLEATGFTVCPQAAGDGHTAAPPAPCEEDGLPSCGQCAQWTVCCQRQPPGWGDVLPGASVTDCGWWGKPGAFSWMWVTGTQPPFQTLPYCGQGFVQPALWFYFFLCPNLLPLPSFHRCGFLTKNLHPNSISASDSGKVNLQHTSRCC